MVDAGEKPGGICSDAYEAPTCTCASATWLLAGCLLYEQGREWLCGVDGCIHHAEQQLLQEEPEPGRGCYLV